MTSLIQLAVILVLAYTAVKYFEHIFDCWAEERDRQWGIALERMRRDLAAHNADYAVHYWFYRKLDSRDKILH